MAHLLPVPVVLQTQSHDCGPAAAHAVLAHFYRPPAGVGRVLRPCRRDGTPPGRLAWLFAAAGLRVEFRHRMSVAALGRAVGEGRVAVCPVQAYGDGHWVVVRGVSARRVYVMDPAEGYLVLPRGRFRCRWHDATAAGLSLVRFAILVGG